MATDPLAAHRQDIKAQLLAEIEALDQQQALLPNHRATLEPLMVQLEALSPMVAPLAVERRQTLLGSWQLIYASRGTVVTRRLTSLVPSFVSFTLERVWQELSASSNQTIAAENGAVLSIPWVGQVWLCARGFWRWEVQEPHTAQVSFSNFSLQLQKPLGLFDWPLPSLTVPVLDFLRQEALWTTSYLDEDLRLGRGASGNRFVFKRA